MIFSSIDYIYYFLPTVVFLYFFTGKLASAFKLNRVKAQLLVLLASSFIFYIHWKKEYIILLLFSILFNYAIAWLINKGGRKKLYLVIGIIENVLLLAFFKYIAFFTIVFNDIFSTTIHPPEIELPLAISFFTFQLIAFLVDHYKVERQAVDILSFSVFKSFFPQLIAGPIIRYHHVIGDYVSAQNKKLNLNNFVLGLFVFGIGLFKKVAVADTLALVANQGYGNIAGIDFSYAWLATLCYTMQIYFDFSGYSDMAIGAALLFNIHLPINFFSPYRARNIQEFWRRWHISLASWLRDYIYIPLGGGRTSSFRVYRNILLTFMLSGLWHGANYTFIIWGIMHGIGVMIVRFFRFLPFKPPLIFSIALTFLFVHVSWVFFRAESLHDAWAMLEIMSIIPEDIAMNAIKTIEQHKLGCITLAASFIIIFLPNSNNLKDGLGKKLENLQSTFTIKMILPALAVGLFIFSTFLISSILLLTDDPVPFLYFNF